MIHASIKIRVPNDKVAAVSAILSPIAESIRRLNGCIESGLYQDLSDPGRILYEEHWESDNHLDNHLASERYRDVLMAMELASEMPVVRFHKISESSSMDRISQVREN
jgi:quinol monooxygenase YgiN